MPLNPLVFQKKPTLVGIQIPNLCQEVLDKLSPVFSRIDEQSVDMAVDEIARASLIALYGIGREGLQIKGFANRLSTHWSG